MAKSAPKAKRPTKKEVRAERRSSRRSGNVTEITPGVSPELDERRRQPTRLSYKTQAQYHYMDSIRKNILTIGDGPAGTGKAQPLDSLVRTPSGWLRMGEVTVGTIVATPDGGQAPVTAVFPQGKKDIYRINFEDGRSAECCPEHLWRVYCYDWQPSDSRWRIIDTEALIDLLRKPSYTNRLYVQLLQPDEGVEKDLPIDPYLLGLLIGDGHLGENCVRLTTSDEFIIEQVRQILPPSMTVEHRQKFDYALVKVEGRGSKDKNPLLEALRELGLTGLKSPSKRIPSEYLEGSLKQKLSLIQGLMDSDGTVDKATGTPSFCTTSLTLAAQFQYLIRSIGGLAKSCKRPSTYVKEDGSLGGCGIAFNITVRIPNRIQLFRLPRKIENIPEEYQYGDNLRLRVRSIEYVGVKEAQCISVDHVDHLYITDGFVVTHNTFVCTKFACEELEASRISKIIVTRPAIEAADEQMGFLPGTLEEKFAPYFQPFREIFVEHFGASHLDNLMKRGRIEVAPMAYIRGLTFRDAFIILDEAQNTSPKQMKLFLTRVGENTTVVVNGDTDQKDIKGLSGLEDLIARVGGMPSVGHIAFEDDDIVRSGFVKDILTRYRRR